jgi:hypothetical protein
VSLLPFLELANGPAVSATNIDAFVRDAADGQRAVEFIHEYEIPLDLYAVYAPVTEPTTTTVENMTLETSPVDRTITLRATVTNTTPVNAGTVTFTVRTGAAVVVGLPAVSTFFTNGVATASYVVPADTAVQVLDLEASYSGAPRFAPSIGMGTLEIVAMVPPVLPVSNGSADFDGDGIYDILVQHDTDWAIAAWRMNYSEPIGTLPIGTPGPDWKIAGIADLDGDGVSDILLQHTNSYVGAWKMNATGEIVSFLQVAFYDLGDWKVVGTADLDGDADSDILLQHSNGYVGAWRMDGAGNATEFLPVVFSDTNGWKVVGAADVDSDGISDILLQHTNSYVGYWKMDGAGNAGAFSFVAEYDIGGWRVVGTLDLNDDNKADILLQNADSWVGAWLMNGAGQPTEFVPVVFEDTGGWWVNGRF